jgi:hypothetical protein
LVFRLSNHAISGRRLTPGIFFEIVKDEESAITQMSLKQLTLINVYLGRRMEVLIKKRA